MSRLWVVPSILTDDAASLSSMARSVERFADYVQIDFMDGIFVPSHSVNLSDVAALNLRIPWEAHLMVEKPQEWLRAASEAGASKVIFHLEASGDFLKLASDALALRLRVGLAVNPETPAAAALPLLQAGLAESLLFLSVHPGYYGRPFIPKVLEKIADFRRITLEAVLGIDGGINESNLADVVRSGADVAYVGSGILMVPDPASAFHSFHTLAARL